MADEADSNNQNDASASSHKEKSGKIQILVPKKSNLKDRLRTNDIFFLDFVRNLLLLDPYRRFSAEDALNHPWLTQAKYDEVL